MLRRLFTRKAPAPKAEEEEVIRPQVVVRTRAQEKGLFNVLQRNRPRMSRARLAELCGQEIGRDESIGWLSEDATHILRVYEGKYLMTFAYFNDDPTDPSTNRRADYAELILICGSYTSGGKYPWKGSELIVDKANQLAQAAGKKALRLEALNQTLIDKVYAPMGFKEIPGRRLIAERPVTGGLRLQKQTRRAKRHTRNHKRRKLRNLTTRRR